MYTTVLAELKSHYQRLSSTTIAHLMQVDSKRFANFSLTLPNGLLFDYCKQLIDAKALDGLINYCAELKLKEEIEKLFSGAIVNVTESRPASHMQLRALNHEDSLLSDKENLLFTIAEKIRASKKKVLCLGIGGSELGPKLLLAALPNYYINEQVVEFISNVDPLTLKLTLQQFSTTDTILLISSKTFTTIETMTNAKTIIKELNLAKESIYAITANPTEASKYCAPSNIVTFPSSVGGRFSISSAIALPALIKLGAHNFKEFLLGMQAMDEHFQQAPYVHNMPVIMGLLTFWNNTIAGCNSQLIMPYADNLALLPTYLQQLEMESNGKQSLMDTCPIIWGGVGCNGQHAYMQLLHQGTKVVPVDFLIGCKAEPQFMQQQQILFASCLSQSKALMEGNESDDMRFCPGNRPSSTILYPSLTPSILGSIIAAYEHKVFVAAKLWQVNPFDQFGVEIGKKLGNELINYIEGENDLSQLDASSQGLIAYYQKYHR